jgi:hypothetical protein
MSAGPAPPGFQIFIQIKTPNLFIRPQLQCALVADHENSLALPEINSPDVWRADNNRVSSTQKRGEREIIALALKSKQTGQLRR